jgi:hypothetical protein
MLARPGVVALVAQAIDASPAGAVAFAGALGALVPMQRHNLDAIRGTAARFPTPPG